MKVWRKIYVWRMIGMKINLAFTHDFTAPLKWRSKVDSMGKSQRQSPKKPNFPLSSALFPTSLSLWWSHVLMYDDCMYVDTLMRIFRGCFSRRLITYIYCASFWALSGPELLFIVYKVSPAPNPLRSNMCVKRFMEISSALTMAISAESGTQDQWTIAYLDVRKHFEVLDNEDVKWYVCAIMSWTSYMFKRNGVTMKSEALDMGLARGKVHQPCEKFLWLISKLKIDLSNTAFSNVHDLSWCLFSRADINRCH